MVEGFNSVQDVSGVALGMEQVPSELVVHPKAGGSTEDLRESKSGIGGDCSATVDEAIEALEGDLHALSEFSLCETQRLQELVEQHGSRVTGRLVGWHSDHFRLAPSSVVIHDLDISGAAFGPAKADAVLLVDSNTEGTPAVALQGFESIAGRNPEILEPLGVVDEEELFPGPVEQIRWTDLPRGFGSDAVEDILGALITEFDRHGNTLAHVTCYR